MSVIGVQVGDHVIRSVAWVDGNQLDAAAAVIREGGSLAIAPLPEVRILYLRGIVRAVHESQIVVEFPAHRETPERCMGLHAFPLDTSELRFP